MAVVRYTALVALVVWLGAMQAVIFGNRTAHFSLLEYTCGGMLVVSLFTLKFIGPPPRAFFTRVGIALTMLAVTLFSDWRGASTAPTLINAVLGLVLLTWYAHE